MLTEGSWERRGLMSLFEFFEPMLESWFTSIPATSLPYFSIFISNRSNISRKMISLITLIVNGLYMVISNPASSAFFSISGLISAEQAISNGQYSSSSVILLRLKKSCLCSYLALILVAHSKPFITGMLRSQTMKSYCLLRTSWKPS